MLFPVAKTRTASAAQTGEEGYLLLTVLVMVFLVLIALSVAAPRVAKEIQRDKELETVQRGLQYRRAIQLYYKKFGNYPTDIKQLENTNQVRYLRKRYTDPMTGKDDWRLIHVGEAKVKPMGFFGQPLQTGLSTQSTGPGISPGTTTGTSTDPSGNTPTDPNAANGLSNSGSTPGSSGPGFGSSGSSFGPGSGGSGFGSSGSGFGPGSNSGTGLGSSTNGPGTSPFGTGNGKFGGGPIVGVGIPGDKSSLIEYHKQKKYAQWEFVYDPAQDAMGGGILNGGNVNGGASNGAFGNNGSNPGSSSGPGFGPQSGNGGGFGPGSSSGSNGPGFGSSSGNGPGSTPQPQ